MARAFETVSDADQYLVIGSFGRGFALDRTVEELVGSVSEKSRLFRDIDIINSTRPLHPKPDFYTTPDHIKIDTHVARLLRPTSENSLTWGFYDRFRSDHTHLADSIAEFSLESLGIQPVTFSDNSDKTVTTPDACGFLLVQEGFNYLCGNRSFKHSEQYNALEERRRQLCTGGDHTELERSVKELKRYREICPPPARNKMKEFIGGFAPHLVQTMIDGRIGTLYRQLKHVPEPTPIRDLAELIT